MSSHRLDCLNGVCLVFHIFYFFPLCIQCTRRPDTCRFLFVAGFSFEVCVDMSLKTAMFRQRLMKTENKYLAAHPLSERP